MKKFFIVLALLCALPGLNTSAQQSATAPQKIRFAAEIEAFLKADQEKPPPSNAILFIGSSIFRRWGKNDGANGSAAGIQSRVWWFANA